MAVARTFEVGDRVVHSGRPEWGGGIVDEAKGIIHQGHEAQRLVVKFTHKGRVTLNTGVAKLQKQDQSLNHNVNLDHRSGQKQSKDATNIMRKETSSFAPVNNSKDGGWLASLEGKNQTNELHSLPESLNDPFSTLEERIEATLNTLRFSTEPRSLMEWAVAQTGLDDPMSKYTRHELEQGFEWYCRDRDLHLRTLLRQAKQDGRAESIDQLSRTLKLPAAVSALDKARNSL